MMASEARSNRSARCLNVCSIRFRSVISMSAPNVPGVIEKRIRAHQGLNHVSTRGADFELDSPYRLTRRGGPLEWKLVKRKLHPILVYLIGFLVIFVALWGQVFPVP